MQDEDDKSFRVLSIQSHMVSGYCGNKAAVFPLQTLGFDVDILNTVQFSNHTGYPSWTGKRLNAEEVQELFDGLEGNGLFGDYTHVLTGYIGNYAILETIEKTVQKLNDRGSNVLYVCDPVMGDLGRLYVAPEIIPLYRNILRIANVVTPNQFEAELLSDIKIDSIESAKLAAKKLHELGAPNVIITSLQLPIKDIPSDIVLPDADESSLYCLVSQKDSDQHLISFPTYQGYFTGTGDLFSALVVARWQEELSKSPDSPSLAQATLRVVASVNAVTCRTWLHQQKHIKELTQGQIEQLNARPSDPALVRCCELQLIKGRRDIENPDLESVKMKRL